MGRDVACEMSQRAEDVLVLLIVRAQYHAILLGYDQRDLQDIDGVEPESLAIQWRFRIDLLGRVREVQSLYDQTRDFPLENQWIGSFRGGLWQ